MSPEQWASILAAVGVGSILTEAFRALWKWVGGKAGRELNVVERERKRADAERDRADEADREKDIEARRRRKAQEYAAKLRRVSIEHGIPLSDLPAWPTELLD
jgi:hypothetical protein